MLPPLAERRGSRSRVFKSSDKNRFMIVCGKLEVELLVPLRPARRICSSKRAQRSE